MLQTDKQPDKQLDIDRQLTNNYIDIQTDNETYRPTNNQTDMQTDNDTYRQTDNYTNRQTDLQTKRPECVSTKIPAGQEYCVVWELGEHVTSEVFHVVVLTLIALLVVAVLHR